jgi:hypothetical protein
MCKQTPSRIRLDSGLQLPRDSSLEQTPADLDLEQIPMYLDQPPADLDH